MDLAALRKSFGECTPEEITAGCNALDPRIDSYEAACQWLWIIIRRLLDANKYRAAALLLWGPDLFDPRPRGVARILEAIENNAKVIVLGAASSGKSYSIIAWLLLDWLRDPGYTAIRIISATSQHALQNTFSSLQRFYDEAVVPMPGISQQGFVGLSTRDRHSSLSVIAIKEGINGKQTVQGLHPVKRPSPHPVFGPTSRIRIFMDECELIAHPVWKGVGNITSNIDGKDTVKIIAACNPWDINSVVASNAEPSKGWNKVDADQDFQWKSKMGYNVIRVDAAYSENVLQKKLIYPGLMSYEGYEEKRSKTGGNDSNYWCYGRGMYPLEGVSDQLIPLNFLSDAFGTYLFDPGTEIFCGAVDLAFEGDDCVLCAARYGRASAWRQSDGILNIQEPKYCLQIDQFITLEKLRTEPQYDNILEWCKKFGISTRWLALDKTGVGRGVHDLFVDRGHEVMGIGWGNSATHVKALSEHKCYADEVYQGISSQMYFALRDWLEFQYLKFSPNIQMDKLQKEITGRKRKRAGMGRTGETLFAIEEKSAFKARYGFSPDRCDSLVMLILLCITKGEGEAQMERRKKPPTPLRPEGDENIGYIDFSEAG